MAAASRSAQPRSRPRRSGSPTPSVRLSPRATNRVHGSAIETNLPQDTPDARGSGGSAVAQEHEAVSEPPLVQQLQVEADAGGQRPRAAADDHRRHEQVTLVDEPRPERMRRQAWTDYREVAVGLLLHPPDGLGI